MLIDLSHPILSAMPVYPGDEPVVLEKIRDLEQDKYNAYLLKTGLHAGTHVDAPLHLLDGGKSIDQMPLERFVAPGVLLTDSQCLPEQEIPIGSAVLIDFYTEGTYGTAAYYQKHPQMSEALCRYLIERRVSLVGVNAPSLDYPPFPIHKQLLAAGIPILENLKNLRNLTGRDFILIALPLSLAAEGSLVRAVAWIPEEKVFHAAQEDFI